MLGSGADKPPPGVLPVGQMEAGSPTLRFGLKASMAITHVLLVVALSGIAFAFLVFLLRTRRRSRIRRSAIDSQYEQILDRRLLDLQEECLNRLTQRHIAEQIRLILNSGMERLCLPPPDRP